jgi:hypothetical protein
MQRHLLSIFIGSVIAVIVGGIGGTQMALFPLVFLIIGDSRDGFGLTDFVLLIGLYGGAITGVLTLYWFQLRKYPYVKRAVTQLGLLLLLEFWFISFFDTSNLYATGILLFAGTMAVASSILIAAVYYRSYEKYFETPN